MALLIEAHCGTWFSVEGLKLVIAFVKGAAAGTPLADLVFCAALARILSRLQRSLIEEGLVHADINCGCAEFWAESSNEELQTSLFHLVAYMDDVAIPLIGNPKNISNKVKSTFGIAASIFCQTWTST